MRELVWAKDRLAPAFTDVLLATDFECHRSFRKSRKLEKENHNGEQQNRTKAPESRVAGSMACRAKGVVEEGEGVLAASRRTGPAAPGTSLGKSRQGLCVRWAEGQGDSDRSLRRAKPIDRVSLHARSGLEGRLPELLVHFGSY